jgi:hypothetical protein
MQLVLMPLVLKEWAQTARLTQMESVLKAEGVGADGSDAVETDAVSAEGVRSDGSVLKEWVQMAWVGKGRC